MNGFTGVGGNFSGQSFLFLGNVYPSPPPNVPQSFHPHDTIAMAAALLMASVLTGMEMHVAWNTTLEQRGTFSSEPAWRVHVAGEVTLMAVQMENGMINVTKLNTSTGVPLGSVAGLGSVVYTPMGFAAWGPYFAMVNLKQEVCVHDVDTLQEVWCVGVVPPRLAIKGDTFIYSHGDDGRDVTACSTKTGAKLWSATVNMKALWITIGDTLAAVSTGDVVSVFHVDTGVLAYSTPYLSYTPLNGHVFDADNNLIGLTASQTTADVFSPTGQMLVTYRTRNGRQLGNANILPDSSLITTEINANDTLPKQIARLDKTGEQRVWSWDTTGIRGYVHLMPERNQLAVVTTGSLEVLSLETGKSVGAVPVFDYQDFGAPADDGKGNIIFGTLGSTATGKKVIFAMSAQLP